MNRAILNQKSSTSIPCDFPYQLIFFVPSPQERLYFLRKTRNFLNSIRFHESVEESWRIREEKLEQYRKKELVGTLVRDRVFIGGLESSVLNIYVSRLFRIFFLLDLFLITRSLFLSIRYSRRYDSRGCISDVNYLQLSHDSHRSPDDKRVFTSRNILFS